MNQNVKKSNRLFVQPHNTMEYEVKSNDTLTKLALMYDTTIGDIVQTNRLINRMIYPGQILYVPIKKIVDNKGNDSIPHVNSHNFSVAVNYSPAHNDYRERTTENLQLKSECSIFGIKFMEDGQLFQEQYIQIKAISIGDGQVPTLGSILFTPNLIHFQRFPDQITNKTNDKQSLSYNNTDHQIPIKAVAFIDFYENYEHLLHEKLDHLIEPEIVQWYIPISELDPSQVIKNESTQKLYEFNDELCFDDMILNESSLEIDDLNLRKCTDDLNISYSNGKSSIYEKTTESIPICRTIKNSMGEHYDNVLKMVIIDETNDLQVDQKQLLEGLGCLQDTPSSLTKWIEKSQKISPANKKSAFPKCSSRSDQFFVKDFLSGESDLLRSKSDNQINMIDQQSYDNDQHNTTIDNIIIINNNNNNDNSNDLVTMKHNESTIKLSSSLTSNSLKSKRNGPFKKMLQSKLINKYFKNEQKSPVAIDISKRSKTFSTTKLQKSNSIKPVYVDNSTNKLSDECRLWLEQRGIIFDSSINNDCSNISQDLLNEIKPRNFENEPKNHFVYVSLTVNPGFWNPMLRTTFICGQPKNRDIKRRQLWFVISRNCYSKIYSFLKHSNENIKNSRYKIKKSLLNDVQTSKREKFNKSQTKTTIKSIDAPKQSLADQISQEEKSLLDLKLLPELSSTSQIMDHSIIMSISWYVPTQAVSRNLTLCFSTTTHGISLRSLLRYCQVYDCPTLLVIKDEVDTIFGAILSHSLKTSNSFYGSGECVLFTKKNDKTVQFFTWTGQDDYFINCSKKYIAIGGGGGNFGIWIDEDLYHGSTSTCNTFNNDPLTNSRDFICKILEVWVFDC